MRTVLVAIDESDASERVVEFVNDFFSDEDTEVIGINVAETPAVWLPPTVGWGRVYAWPYRQQLAGWADTVEKEARTAEHEAQATVCNSGLERAEAVSDIGNPAEAIRAAAEQRNADLIVVGTNHKTFFQRLTSPSVSQDIVKHAERPVLVVP